MLSPLIDLTRSNKAWKWTDKCTKAIKKLNYNLIHAPVLRMSEFSKPFEVMTNALKYFSRAVLMQEGQPIALDSQKFNKAELNYTMSE